MSKKIPIVAFALLYPTLFIFDGVAFLEYAFRSNDVLYLVYVLILGLGLYAFREPLKETWQKVRRAPFQYLVRVLTGYGYLFVLTIVFGIVTALLRDRLGITGIGQNNENVQYALQVNPVMMLLAGVIIGPAVEELFFRQFLLETISRRWNNKGLAVAVVAVLFSMTHMHSLGVSEWVAALSYMGGGIALCTVYLFDERRIWTSFGVHCLNNVIAFIVLLNS